MEFLYVFTNKWTDSAYQAIQNWSLLLGMFGVVLCIILFYEYVREPNVLTDWRFWVTLVSILVTLSLSTAIATSTGNIKFNYAIAKLDGETISQIYREEVEYQIVSHVKDDIYVITFTNNNLEVETDDCFVSDSVIYDEFIESDEDIEILERLP